MTDDVLPIQPAYWPIRGEPRIPGSKSITNRALALAAFACGESHLRGALFSDDTLLMVKALRDLGIQVETSPSDHSITVHGCAGVLPAQHARIYVGNAGTVARFVTALASVGRGTFTLDGSERMRERPMGPLLRALGALGVQAESVAGSDCPPILICTTGLPGGAVTVEADVSSQFLSGLLMAAPYARSTLEISVPGPLSSEPYVAMTIRMMQDWGLRVFEEREGTARRYRVPAPQLIEGRQYTIEPDATAASYFMAAAVIMGGSVRIRGLGRSSLQGDVAFADVLRTMGAGVDFAEDILTVTGTDALRGVSVDMNAISDTVMTLAAIAPFAESPTRIRNVAHIRYKECDRIEATATELRRLGLRVLTHPDGLTVYPGTPRGAPVETYNDHRIAMSLALVGLRTPGVLLRNPSCVSKTFPDFFAELQRLSDPPVEM